MNIINLTPHDLHFYSTDRKNTILTVKSSGNCRVSSKSILSTEIELNGVYIPVRSIEYGDIETVYSNNNSVIKNFPERKENTIYIVSLLVKQLCKDRDDILCVDTNPSGVVRDDKGVIIGTTGLVM